QTRARRCASSHPWDLLGTFLDVNISELPEIPRFYATNSRTASGEPAVAHKEVAQTRISQRLVPPPGGAGGGCFGAGVGERGARLGLVEHLPGGQLNAARDADDPVRSLLQRAGA